MKYKTIDLCAGIGGIRKGFELTGGFENVLSAECLTWEACQQYIIIQLGTFILEFTGSKIIPRIFFI